MEKINASINLTELSKIKDLEKFKKKGKNDNIYLPITISINRKLNQWNDCFITINHPEAKNNEDKPIYIGSGYFLDFRYIKPKGKENNSNLPF